MDSLKERSTCEWVLNKMAAKIWSQHNILSAVKILITCLKTFAVIGLWATRSKTLRKKYGRENSFQYCILISVNFVHMYSNVKTVDSEGYVLDAFQLCCDINYLPARRCWRDRLALKFVLKWHTSRRSELNGWFKSRTDVHWGISSEER